MLRGLFGVILALYFFFLFNCFSLIIYLNWNDPSCTTNSQIWNILSCLFLNLQIPFWIKLIPLLNQPVPLPEDTRKATYMGLTWSLFIFLGSIACANHQLRMVIKEELCGSQFVAYYAIVLLALTAIAHGYVILYSFLVLFSEVIETQKNRNVTFTAMSVALVLAILGLGLYAFENTGIPGSSTLSTWLITALVNLALFVIVWMNYGRVQNMIIEAADESISIYTFIFYLLIYLPFNLYWSAQGMVWLYTEHYGFYYYLAERTFLFVWFMHAWTVSLVLGLIFGILISMILEVTGLVSYNIQYPHHIPAETPVNPNDESNAESVAFLKSVKGDDESVNESFSSNKNNSTEIQVNTDHMCAICWEPLEKSQKLVYVESCKHQYHRLCISTWMQHNRSCPSCRKKIRFRPTP